MATIEITHTRAEGTILTGSSKGDGVFEIVRDHGFWFSRNVDGLYIRRSQDKEAQMWRINGAAEALRAAGHEVTVEIKEEVRRSFAEAEAAREERAEDRVERFSERAGRAVASADARREKADQISKRFEFGQPILVGHHSERRARRDAERIDTNMRKSFEERDRAAYWADRTRASENYAKHRNDPHRTLRRLERLRADLRAQERHHAEAVEKGWSSVDRHARLILDLTEEIAHWEQIVEKAKAEGVKIWGPDDFAPGDYVRYSGSWYQVARVNPKTLSIAWNLRLAPKQVMSLEDATFDGGRVGTHTADYTQVRARCPEAAMNAFLADGKVPGTKSADAASMEQPASAVREARAAAKFQQKGKSRKASSDPKVAKRVLVTCPLGGAEATVTWLNGNSRPHKDFEPVTITAPEGERFHRAVWSKSLQAEIARVLGERGYVCGKDDWTVSRDRGGFVRSVEPKPQEPAAAVDQEPQAPEPAIDETPAVVEPAPEPKAPKVWGRSDFKKGDYVQAEGRWHEVLRSNPRSVSVPGPDVYLIQWDMVTGRRSAAEMAEALAAEADEDQAPAEVTPKRTEAPPEGAEKTASDLRFSSSNPVPQGSSEVSHSVHPLSSTPHSERPETMTDSTTTPAPEVIEKAPAKKAPRKAPAKRVVEPTKVSKRREVVAETAAAAAEKAATQKTIPIDRIDRDLDQPRKLFDQAKLEELAGSMRELGQLQPISVWYNPGTRRYQIIMGERRWRAAKMAGLTKMTALVLHGAVAGSRELLAKQVAENVGRADMTPMEEAKSFKDLETAGYEIEEIGRMCGKSPAYVGWRIDLLKLCAPAQDAMSKGILGVNLAWYAAQLSDANQMRFLSRYTQGGFAGDREAEAFVKACRAEEERRESQGSFFVLSEENPAKKGDVQESILGDHDVPQEERERIISERSKLTKKIERLSVAGEILAELATADPEELALLLAGAAGGVEAHSKRIGHLRKLAGQVIGNLTKAQAIASVRASGIEINPAAVAETDAA
ncbi:ParB/RepB/Spo0J family partition protein [Actinacidiphila sp. DG2A-62]|uniref:ParB/RepB/Spo0J family partition protein n=1 Tax=Actinacidiphila sp. DG2A-62 TaxID=3108821 RepID=UPI002DBB11AE|nr:ParB/RepB/Spo0J family partition protein [Actinacidiphila sp. DG2A-62]MEC3995186.1 ParB/RepB/Spo0J family partition protein [Actinacidiphila sp. DG2A-62]